VRILSPTILDAVNDHGIPEQQFAWDLSPVAFESIPFYLCPSAKEITVDGRTISNGALNHFLSGARFEQIGDGTSHTLLVCEILSERASLWTWGPLADRLNISSEHADRVTTSMADGSVRGLSKALDPSVLHGLLDPNDGRILRTDD
jgi:hypothetical protein